MATNEHPLNVESNKVNIRRNLLKGGKINALLDQMENDALENWIEADNHRKAGWSQKLSRWESDKREEDLQIQKDAYALSRSIRKYTPFIETGAMTIAEAISCETQKQAALAAQTIKKT